MMRIFELERLAAEGKYDSQSQLQRYIYNLSERAFAGGDADRDAVADRESLAARARYAREVFLKGLGGLPECDAPLQPSVTGVEQFDGYRVEKIIFQSRPHVYVTANLYLPDDIASPRGAVLFLCGHSDKGKAYANYQIVCQYLVRAGLVVLAQDPVGQGERFSYYEKSTGMTTVPPVVPEHTYAGMQCWAIGDSSARYFLHDAQRSIAYLRSRPEVDPERIGVTGSSGGGTQTTMLMLSDQSIAAAAPGTFLMDRRSYMYTGEAQDAEQIWPGMTACGIDHEDILLCMCPRPVMVLACQYDFFPIEGTRRTVERCRRFWEMHGAADNLELVEDASTHAFTRVLAAAAARFFSRHLLGKETQPDGSGIDAVDVSRLQCTASGQVRGEMADARFIYEENMERLNEKRSAMLPLSAQEGREKALSWLGERIVAPRLASPLNPRFYRTERVNDLRVDMCLWWAQEGLFNGAFLFRDYRFEGHDVPVIMGIWEGGTTSLQPHMNWIRNTCASGRAVLVLDLAGMGMMAPNAINVQEYQGDHGTLFKLCSDLIWLDYSLAAMRIGDILRSLDMLDIWPGLMADNIPIYACGHYAGYALLAASLEGRIGDVERVDYAGGASDWVRLRHYDNHDMASFILPGIFEHSDIPIC